MALPAPNLDDRRFQELVDEAKRYVMHRCPEWTDHNVSDPGITLIETFAYMTDALLYRLNRVPDRLYIKFLDLIGLRLLPATPARTGVTFWLSAPAEAPMTIATGTEVATPRTDAQEAIVFATATNLPIIPCAFQGVATQAAGTEERVDRTEASSFGEPFAAFTTTPPAAGDCFLIALTEAVPNCTVLLQVACRIDGHGVDPTNPPLIWETWDGTTWSRCDVSQDDTGGLNRDGAIIVHVPGSHAAAVLDGRRAGWLRARVLQAVDGQPTYSASPIIHSLTAATVGGTVEAVYADVVQGEVLGTSQGVPGQRFKIARAPIVGGGAPLVVEVSSGNERPGSAVSSGNERPGSAVSSGNGWQTWTEVPSFASSDNTDRHITVDHLTGEIAFGPLVRESNGKSSQLGAVPPNGAMVRVPRYAIGGGSRGNVGKGALRMLKSSIPFVSRVENRFPAVGGVDVEDIEAAKERAPIALRTRGRAVTAEDYEHLTREIAHEIARVRCVAATDADAGLVRVLVVPAAPLLKGTIRFEDLVPPVEVLARIAAHLDEVRVIGARVAIEPPLYRGVTIVAQVRARPDADSARVREDCSERLERYFNPLVGGPQGTGWPWGRPVQAGEAFAVLQAVVGVDLVEDVRLFAANMVTGERGPQVQRIDLAEGDLVFSYQHQVRVSAT